MKTRTLAILMAMLSLAAAALLVAAADADVDLIGLPSDGGEGLAAGQAVPAAADATEKEGGEEEVAATPSGADEEMRPWTCCYNTKCTESYSFSPTCRCLDVVDRCAGACLQCEPSVWNPSRRVCKDEYHGDPGPTCPKDDDDDVPSPNPSGASRSVAAAARLLSAFIAALLFIQSR